MAQNEAQILKAQNELQIKFPQIQIRYIVQDLGNLKSISEYRHLVDEHLAELDLGIVVLNAASRFSGPFDLQSDLEIERSISVNTLHTVYFTKALLPKLLGRG